MSLRQSSRWGGAWSKRLSGRTSKQYITCFMIAAASLFSASVARAEDDTDPKPTDQSAYNAFNPAPDSALRAFCTDRPTKSNNPCTVDAGRFQVESDILNMTFQRTGAVTTDTYLFTSPNLKLGITDVLDAEIAFTPVEAVVIHDHGIDSTLTGFGDMVARVKWNLIGNNGGDLSITLSPYVKLPTARQSIGDGAVEEGLLIPVQYNLPTGWQLGFNGEVDALKNRDDVGRHINFVATFSIAHSITKTVTGSAEFWTDYNDDPSGFVRERSFDLALAWIPPQTPNLQFDGGVNIGLNNATPGAQVYVGVSRRSEIAHGTGIR